MSVICQRSLKLTIPHLMGLMERLLCDGDAGILRDDLLTYDDPPVFSDKISFQLGESSHLAILGESSHLVIEWEYVSSLQR
jgi:hypothetical protein